MTSSDWERSRRGGPARKQLATLLGYRTRTALPSPTFAALLSPRRLAPHCPHSLGSSDLAPRRSDRQACAPRVSQC